MQGPRQQRHKCRAGPQLAEACRALQLELPVSSPEEVRQAYLRLMRRQHPDVNPHTDTTAQAAEINLAYRTVLEV